MVVVNHGFRDPDRAPASELVRFLQSADRLPGMRAIRRALRDALDLRPGMRVLDAGCGIGLETARLAAANPDTLVTGLDRNGELLDVARRRAEPANLRWVEADLAALELPAGGLSDVTATPFSFALDEPVWRKIVKDTVTAAAPPDPAVYAWLREQAAAAARGEFVAAFSGVLTTARRP